MKNNEAIAYYQSTIDSPHFSSFPESVQNQIRKQLQDELAKQAQEEKNDIIHKISQQLWDSLKDCDTELSLLVTFKPGESINVKEYYPPVVEEEDVEEEEDDYVIESNNIGVLDMFEEQVATVVHEEMPETTRKKRKTEGFSVYFPEDGTTICERDAVDTFINALKKIGLPRVAEVRKKHAGYDLISFTERPYDGRKNNPWQKKVDGLFIYTNIGNDVKIADLKEISEYHSLHLKIESTGFKHGDESHSSKPKINEDAKYYNLPIIEQARMYMQQNVLESTANGYIRVLDNAVRGFISEKIDSDADSVFSYTTVEDVEQVIELLNSDDEFIKENERRHNSMTAALNQYLKFIKSRE